MKAYLMYRDRDVELEPALPPHEQALTQDLALDTLFDAMALHDPFVRDLARKAVLSSLTDPAAIVYRQHVLGDCVAQPATVREIYAIAVEAIERERMIYRSFMQYPDSVLRRSTEVLGVFVGLLKQLRAIADQHAARFQSDGFARFFAMLRTELSDTYVLAVEEHLKQLQLRRGAWISARLGKGNKGVDYVLRRPRTPEPWWRQWIPFGRESPYTLVIADRDESGIHALEALRGRGINATASALAQAADHILHFFHMTRAELAFYVGCLNLRERLATKGEPLCFPEPLPAGKAVLSARGLYDACLSLSVQGRVVGNDLAADARPLVMVTGANQGGKTTFLRSVGLAQLMLQCGMFVAAEAFRASVCMGIFTHYKREEDPTMESGKLDDELRRMSQLADHVTPRCLVLFNESFAATNEREGAEIASGIIRALVEADVRVIYVTHAFELAHRWYAEEECAALFLRAERQADGTRTFRVVEGEPLPTSHGEDLYRRIFTEAAVAAATAAPG